MKDSSMRVSNTFGIHVTKENYGKILEKNTRPLKKHKRGKSSCSDRSGGTVTRKENFGNNKLTLDIVVE